MRGLIDIHFLPSLEYFCCLLKMESVTLEKHEHFVKQTYRNRCYIRGANNVQMLNIPVEKGRSKIAVKDLRTDRSQAWQKAHWKSLVSAYGNAPFFEYYAPDLQKVLERKADFLLDYSVPLLTLCLKWLDINTALNFTEMYENEGNTTRFDLRSVINPKIPFNRRQFYTPVPYLQVFGKNFVPNLSIVDLLSCEGPNARSVLNSSAHE